MTIAIGLLARDGFVIAADTQVGIPGYLNMSFGKVAYGTKRAGGDVSSLVVTGAGNVKYLEALRAAEIEAFLDRDEHPSAGAVEAHLASRIECFEREHVAPYAHLPNCPDVSLLMGYESNGQRRIWVTERNLLIPCLQYGAVGAGEMFAKIVLDQYWFEGDVTSVSVLAAYVLFLVKRHVDGCGHETDLVRVSKSGAMHSDRKVIRNLEEVFREFSDFQAHALRYTLPLGDASGENKADRLFQRLSAIRQKVCGESPPEC